MIIISDTHQYPNPANPKILIPNGMCAITDN
jgi:hypothetical protein